MQRKRRKVWIEHSRDIPQLVTLMNNVDIKVYAPPEMRGDLETILYEYMTPVNYLSKIEAENRMPDVYL